MPFSWAKPFACLTSVNSCNTEVSTNVMALYGEETALGKMLAKVKIFSRAARIMMLVRRALAAMS